MAHTAWLGRYREIVIAVALFLVLDLGVLVLNFYTSFKIAEDAAAINVAGRQRMLSQRMAKLALAAEGSPSAPQPLLEELRAAAGLFDTSLRAFELGGETRGGNNQPLELQAVRNPAGQQALRNAKELWVPLKLAAQLFLDGGQTASNAKALADAARSTNLGLLQHMNALTTALEADAAQRASTLRLVQAAAIVLALLNFAYILFKFIRRLRATDDQVAAVSQENAQILNSVREGLFLIAPDGRMGSQLSTSTVSLLSPQARSGANVFDVLQPMLPAATLQEARDYVEMLLSPRVKEELVQSINPLASVAVHGINPMGQPQLRHLSFAFNRVMQAGQVKHLLATVQDISTQADLQRRLGLERQRAQHELSMLMQATRTDRAQLAAFAQRATAQLAQVNQLLQQLGQGSSAAHAQALLTQAQHGTHAIKGDASALGLELVSSGAHALESQLRQLSGQSTSPDAALLVGLPVALEDLQGKLQLVAQLAHSTQTTPGQATEASWLGASKDWQAASVYDQLAQRVATDLGKQVLVTADMPAWSQLNATQQEAVHDITVQLVRNAVAHGIGQPAARHASLKPAAGRVDVVLFEANGQAHLVVRDDGTGLVQSRLRQRLVDLAWFTADSVKTLSDNQVTAQMFRPGFSTGVGGLTGADVAQQHAGRGVGLDLVNARVQQLGGRIGVGSHPGRYAEFRISFALKPTGASA